jgi:hypothetical protein
LRVVAPRIMSSGTPYCSAIESNTAPSQGGTARLTIGVSDYGDKAQNLRLKFALLQ